MQRNRKIIFVYYYGNRYQCGSRVDQRKQIYKAVLFSQADVLSQNILCLDIGGGSTEIIIGSNGKIVFLESLKLGAVRLSSRFFSLGDLTKNNIEDCRLFIKKELGAVTQKLHSLKMDFVTGNSGMIYAVKNLALANASLLNLEHQEQKVLTSTE